MLGVRLHLMGESPVGLRKLSGLDYTSSYKMQGENHRAEQLASYILKATSRDLELAC